MSNGAPAATMRRISEMTETHFDGVSRPYVPPRELAISETLALHRDWETDIDPVTYEVIRHNLWNINEEHGATIQRISGSPVAIYALDLNPSILTEDAEFVYFGPYMQYMSGVTDTQVKWILEYRSDNPGIREGDMFLANDPWVGAAHQMDVMVICPVFWEGALFCWITNCLHQYDIGGITPGSFCPAAESAFDEGILIPPVKIVENDVVRRDIEELYLRSSRKPEMVALDFRAQLAGNMSARARMLHLVRRYGPRTVKGVMKRIIDNAEAAFLAKLARLPDGAWSDRTYVEACRPGDRRTHRVQITVTKRGNRLIFDNDGTAPQDGAMNATYSGWRGSVMVAINELLAWDQYFAVGGALRHIDFDPTAGTLNCADFPASVSTAPTQSMEISLYPAYNAISKMLYSDETLRGDIMGIGGTSQWPATIFRGIDQWGERYGYLLIDPIGGSIGAFAHGDGINTGGQARTPICQLPNVEHNEQNFPLLVLYRKELPDSGGAGRFRGGLSAETCFIPHNTERITQDTLSSGNATPTSTGMMGGFPSTTNAYQFIRESDILERMAARRMVEDHTEVAGRREHLELRQENFDQHPGGCLRGALVRRRRFWRPHAARPGEDPARPQAPQRDGGSRLRAFRCGAGRGRHHRRCRGDAAEPRRHQGRATGPPHQRRCAAGSPRGAPPAPRHRCARRAGGRRRRLLGLRRVRRAPRRARQELQARLPQGRAPGLGVQPADRRPRPLRRRCGRVPALLLPRLRRADRERDRRRDRPDPAGYFSPAPDHSRCERWLTPSPTLPPTRPRTRTPT